MQQPGTTTTAGTRREGAPPLGDWLTPGRFAGGLGLLILAGFPQVLLGLHTFVLRDFGFFAYPLAYYQREAFWHGELPLWNPYNNCGVPFLAQWNTMPLYPPALVYLLLPLGWSLSFFCLLHLFYAGLGMYFLAHRWTGNRLAASVAGLVFAFNGLTLSLLMWPSHIATLSWMPWVVLCVERAWREGGGRIVLAALTGAMQMLAGGPETILFTWLLLTALWLLELLQAVRLSSIVHPPSSCADSAPRAPAWPLCYRFPLVVALVAGLAAAQLLPFLDLAAHSQREAGYADTRWSLPGCGWANFLVPMAFGSVWTSGVFYQSGQAWTSSYYLGVGTLVLALLAVWTLRERRVRLLALAAVAALLLAWGDRTFAGRWLRHLAPQLSLMTYPVKFVVIIVFSVPLLAGFGIARLQDSQDGGARGMEKRLWLFGGVLLALIAAILVWAGSRPLPTDDFSGTWRNGLGRAAFLGAAVVLLLLLWRARGSNAAAAPEGGATQGARPHTTFTVVQPFLPVLLLLWFWLDLRTHEPQQNPTVPPSVYEPGSTRARLGLKPQPALGESRAMVTPEAEVKFTQFILADLKNNFLVKRLGCFADCNLLDHVPKVNGFFSLYPRECGELNSALYGSTNASFPRLLDFLAVSQVTTPGKFFEWTPRDTFLPLVTAGQQPVFLDDASALRAVTAPDFDGSKVVFLPPEAKSLVTVTNRTSTRVLRPSFTAQQVEFDVEAKDPSVVSLAQTYYHCWRAYVDGKPTPLLRANYAFQAVEVPAGNHRVRLAYEDRAFRLGLCLSGFTLLLCVAGWARGAPILFAHW